MRIDWHKGTWRVWSLDTGQLIVEARRIVIRTVCELVNEGIGRGFAVTAGKLEWRGDVLFILPE